MVRKGSQPSDRGSNPRSATSLTRDMHDPWDEYRRRRLLFWFSAIGCLPGVFVIGFPLVKLFRSDVPAYIVALLWLGFLAIANTRMIRFPCPRCGRLFLVLDGISILLRATELTAH